MSHTQAAAATLAHLRRQLERELKRYERAMVPPSVRRVVAVKRITKRIEVAA